MRHREVRRRIDGNGPVVLDELRSFGDDTVDRHISPRVRAAWPALGGVSAATVAYGQRRVGSRQPEVPIVLQMPVATVFIAIGNRSGRRSNALARRTGDAKLHGSALGP